MAPQPELIDLAEVSNASEKDCSDSEDESKTDGKVASTKQLNQMNLFRYMKRTKVGRPIKKITGAKKKKPKRGRPPKNKASNSSSAPPGNRKSYPHADANRKSYPPANVSTGKPITIPRINWGVGEHLESMTKVVDEWLNKKGEYFDDNDEARSLRVYCGVVDISYKVFTKYV